MLKYFTHTVTLVYTTFLFRSMSRNWSEDSDCHFLPLHLFIVCCMSPPAVMVRRYPVSKARSRNGKCWPDLKVQVGKKKHRHDWWEKVYCLISDAQKKKVDVWILFLVYFCMHTNTSRRGSICLRKGQIIVAEYLMCFLMQRMYGQKRMY